MRTKPPFRPKLDALVGIIDAILAADKEGPKKQRHTSKRIFEQLRDEHGFTGKVTIVKDYVSGWRQRTQEMFVPLVHPPGHAQVDFGEAIGVIGDVERKIHFFAMDLPYSDAILVVATRPRRRKPSATATSEHSRSSTAFRNPSSMTTRRSRWRASWTMAGASAPTCSALQSHCLF